MRKQCTSLPYFILDEISAWHEAMESRPPLRIDMSGPTPTSYSPRNKPLYETNAPAYSFGRKEAPKGNSYVLYRTPYFFQVITGDLHFYPSAERGVLLFFFLFLVIIHPYLFITINGKDFYVTFVGKSALYQPPVVLIRNRLNRISLL